MDELREFHSLHLPHLVDYVVPVIQMKTTTPEVGSGVLVRVGQRHFIATAQHCIDGPKVRAMRSESQQELRRKGSSDTQELHIKGKGWHDELDLGFLEIHDPRCPELGWDQLCEDRIVDGSVQVVGYPEVLTIPIQAAGGKLTDVSLCAGTFGTTLTEETDDRMTFHYPRHGMRYDPATGTLNESEFPKTPKGFSGGAVFGVAKPPEEIARVQYKLLGIQYAWNQKDRVVFAVPIKRWKELLTEKGLAPK